MSTVDKLVAKTLTRLANEARKEILYLMRTSIPEGRTYRRPNGKIHVASAPGQPPAIETGRLINSIGVDVSRAALGVTSAGVMNTTEDVKKYAYDLEYGTQILRPRPFIRPVVEKIKRGY